jgi:hypothetical protein
MKSCLPLVKDLPNVAYNWANLNPYSWMVCEKRILGNFWDFSPEVWIPFKFKQDSNWSLLLKFIIQNLEIFWTWVKRESCVIWIYLSACHVYRISSKRKNMFCIFEPRSIWSNLEILLEIGRAFEAGTGIGPVWTIPPGCVFGSSPTQFLHRVRPSLVSKFRSDRVMSCRPTIARLSDRRPCSDLMSLQC